jgi:hypothetical protein
VNGGSSCELGARLQVYAMTFGLWSFGMEGYRISQLGDATPPRTSTPCHASSFLAMPMVSNHGSCSKNRLVCESLFRSAWVTAFLLCMFTDEITMGGYTTIKQKDLRQRQSAGTRGNMDIGHDQNGQGAALQIAHYQYLWVVEHQTGLIGLAHHLV